MFDSIRNWLSQFVGRLTPQRVFVWVAIIFGLLICFRMQPLFGNDEIVHFPRAYQIQDGHLWTQHLDGYNYGGFLPAQIVQMNDGFREQVQNQSPDFSKVASLKQQYSHKRLSNQNKQAIPFTSAGVYSPWAYLPAALGIWLARLLHLPLIWYIYLARLSCFFIWLLLVYLAIKYIPVGKYFLTVVALLPTTLVQAMTIGMDGIVNGLAWLIVALTLAVFAKKLKLDAKLLAILIALGLYLATTKQGYALIAALPLVIPSSFYNFTKRQTQIVRISFGVVLLIVAGLYIRATAPLANILHFVQRPTVYVDSGSQLRYFLTHPFRITLAILCAPFTLSYLGVYAGVVGVLTNRLIYLPTVLIILLYATLVIAFMRMEGDKQLRPYRYRLFASSASVFTGTFILINLALYLSFTKVGNPHIEGVQGRYLLPLAPLLVAMRAGWNKAWLRRMDPLLITAAATVIFIGLITAAAIIH